MNFTRLGQIAEALEVKPEEIVTFGSVTYNNNVSGGENGLVGHNGTYNNNIPENMMLLERAVFDKMMKDEEIAFLRGLVGKG